MDISAATQQTRANTLRQQAETIATLFDTGRFRNKDVVIKAVTEGDLSLLIEPPAEDQVEEPAVTVNVCCCRSSR